MTYNGSTPVVDASHVTDVVAAPRRLAATGGFLIETPQVCFDFTVALMNAGIGYTYHMTAYADSPSGYAASITVDAEHAKTASSALTCLYATFFADAN